MAEVSPSFVSVIRRVSHLGLYPVDYGLTYRAEEHHKHVDSGYACTLVYQRYDRVPSSSRRTQKDEVEVDP